MSNHMSRKLREPQRSLNIISDKYPFNTHTHTPPDISYLNCCKTKTKRKILKEARDKIQKSKGKNYSRLSETMQIWRQIGMFKLLRERKNNNSQSTILYTVWISFRTEGEIKTFHTKAENSLPSSLGL